MESKPKGWDEGEIQGKSIAFLEEKAILDYLTF